MLCPDHVAPFEIMLMELCISLRIAFNISKRIWIKASFDIPRIWIEKQLQLFGL